MQVWISLRELLDDLESETDYGSLDRVNRRLLEWIAIRSQQDEPLHVQEIITESQVASPATVHKALSNLERKDFISQRIDLRDNRRKIVKTTARADKMFSKLSKAVEVWGQLVARRALAR